MGPFFRSPNSLYSPFIQIASLVASTRERYSDSVEDRTTHVCFFVHQVIGVPLMVNRYAPVDLRWSRSSPQSASV
jgi:hypothetical protein